MASSEIEPVTYFYRNLNLSVGLAVPSYIGITGLDSKVHISVCFVAMNVTSRR
jgi:hypothetical protein